MFKPENRELPWLQTKSSNISLTIIAGKILDSDILNGNLFQEVRILAARVARDDTLPPQPITEPGQVTVTVEGVGQKVAEEDENKCLAMVMAACEKIVCPPVCALTVWTASAECQTLRG